MKTKHLISIAAAMLFMLASLATQAQDVYEYATIYYNYNSNTKTIVSYSNGKYEEIESDGVVKGFYNSSPSLKVLAKMNAEGWEIVNSTGDGPIWRFLLKRKMK